MPRETEAVPQGGAKWTYLMFVSLLRPETQAGPSRREVHPHSFRHGLIFAALMVNVHCF